MIQKPQFSINKNTMHLIITQVSKHLRNLKTCFFAFSSCFPTSLLALILLLLLIHNGFSVFYIHLPLPANSPPPSAVAGKSLKKVSSSVMYAVKEEDLPLILKTQLPLLPKFAIPNIPINHSSVLKPNKVNTPPPSTAEGKSLKKVSSSVMYAVKEETLPVILNTQLPLLPKFAITNIPINHSSVLKPNKVNNRKAVIKILHFGGKSKQFGRRISGFLANSSCEVQFFMTWISSLQSFGDREMFSIESIFKSHPNACLVIVSNSIDCKKGYLLLKPLLDKGYNLAAITPDFSYIFKGTYAESWFNELKKGKIDPGEVPLGQNLSNLVRLALLYKFGGIYVDTDVIVLKSFSKLRNAIGAQTIDLETGNWSRLNNAVLIFDKKHPLLFKFIQEFALTFNGNKWGHNGPYLVSRVVSRVNGRTGFNFSVLPPSAFYPVNWSRIRSFFRGPGDEVHSQWLHKKLLQIRRESLAVHLWNKQSRKIRIENGSIISYILLDSCVFCKFSSLSLVNYNKK